MIMVDWRQMKARQFTTLLFLCSAALLTQPSVATPPTAQTPHPTPTTSAPISAPAAQLPAAAPGMQIHTSDYGFSYSIPLDWEIIDTKPMMPVVQEQLTQKETSESGKKGAACIQIVMLARHGSPKSVIEAVVLPFDCYGKSLTDTDLPSFAGGVAKGLKKSFDISDPVYGAYTLGAHSFWIARATGTYIDHPEVKRTIETVCTLLKKGAVCWMALAADLDALQTFEQGAVTLEGKAEPTLVPPGALQKKQ
jgi:hypothetical protein